MTRLLPKAVGPGGEEGQGALLILGGCWWIPRENQRTGLKQSRCPILSFLEAFPPPVS